MRSTRSPTATVLTPLIDPLTSTVQVNNLDITTTADKDYFLVTAPLGSSQLTVNVQAGKIVGALAAKVGGKGGGRPDLAEAGGSDAGALDGARPDADREHHADEQTRQAAADQEVPH